MKSERNATTKINIYLIIFLPTHSSCLKCIGDKTCHCKFITMFVGYVVTVVSLLRKNQKVYLCIVSTLIDWLRDTEI